MSKHRLSQLEVSLRAEVSARHLSFVETGRAVPGRELILRLGEELEIPLIPELGTPAAHEWNINSHVVGQREQTLEANLAAAYRVSRWFTPVLEMNTVTRTSGSEQEEGPQLLRRVQLHLTPGFNVQPLPRVTLRAVLQLPVSTAREFDYALHGALVWEF